MSDRTTIKTVAEALAGVTITDPDFEGLEREDWRELAAAAHKAVRAVDAEAPEGADLAYLSDRARAYVIGLEARLKMLRQENDELRTKLPDLLARAWDQGLRAEQRRQEPCLLHDTTGEDVPGWEMADEVMAVLGDLLPDLLDQLAQAWDEGRRIGLTQADYEYGHRLTMPNLTNPYRKEARDA